MVTELRLTEVLHTLACTQSEEIRLGQLERLLEEESVEEMG